jgi:hypothetical protein
VILKTQEEVDAYKAGFKKASMKVVSELIERNKKVQEEVQIGFEVNPPLPWVKKDA